MESEYNHRVDCVPNLILLYEQYKNARNLNKRFEVLAFLYF